MIFKLVGYRIHDDTNRRIAFCNECEVACEKGEGRLAHRRYETRLRRVFLCKPCLQDLVLNSKNYFVFMGPHRIEERLTPWPGSMIAKRDVASLLKEYDGEVEQRANQTA